MPKKPLSPEVIELIQVYQKAQVSLINIIATQEARGNVTAYRKAILTSVNQELATLNKYAEGWAEKVIPEAYKTGAAATYAAFRKANIDVGKVQINQKVVDTLVRNTVGQLEDATAFVGRRIADDVRKAGLEAIAEKVSTGSTVKQAKENLLSKLTENGITAIRDKNGREINLDAYASTVARTTTREATNKAALQTAQDLGSDLVQISQHFSACPVCAVYEGRVYSISGESKEYPPLDEAFSGGYSTIHPNCDHVAVPYFPEFDPNAEQLKIDSNKPFEIDPAKQKSIDAYNKGQAIKTQLRQDRDEWLKARSAAPNETPKTLSAYKAVKKSGNERYQAIQEAVKNKSVSTTEKEAVEQWVNQGAFGIIRKYQESGVEIRNAKKLSDNIESYISKTEKTVDNLYRGFSMKPSDIDEIISQGEFVDLGTGSWTVKKSVAREYASEAYKDKIPVIFKIENAKGADIRSFSKYAMEDGEYLVSKKYKFKLTDISEESGVKTILFKQLINK